MVASAEGLQKFWSLEIKDCKWFPLDTGIWSEFWQMSRNYLGWKTACVKPMKGEAAWSVEGLEGDLEESHCLFDVWCF